MSKDPQPSVPRGRRIPLSRFWLDWRISIFLLSACVLIFGVAVVALLGGPDIVPSPAGTSPTAHRERAQFFEGLGKTDDAIREYQAALRVDPEDPALHQALALLLEKEGRFVEAITAYERFLELEPDSATAVAVRTRIGELRQRR